MKKNVFGIAFTTLLLSACGGGGGVAEVPSNNPPAATFTLSSTAFSNGSSIPNEYRCVPAGGAGNLPQLAWSNLPSGTKSIVIIMDDTDAASVQGTTYTHYLAVIPFEKQVNKITQIDEVSNPILPYEKVTEVENSNWIVLADIPPCNPETTPHNYRWSIYALNEEYTSIPALEASFNQIINGALSSTSQTENLNSYNVSGSIVEITPKITRRDFESTYNDFILGKSTLLGKM